MFWNIRLIPALLVVAAGALLAACGGSGDGDSASSRSEPDAFVLNGTEALSRSAESFSTEVTSGSGSFEFTFESNSYSISGDAEFAFDAPDRMYLAMSFSGGGSDSIFDIGELGDMELLARDGTVYVNIPFLGGWYSMSPEDLADDSEGLEELISQNAMFDYTSFLDTLESQVDYLGEEEVNGHVTDHYAFSGTLGGLVEAFSDSLANGESGTELTDVLTAADLSGPVNVDVWVGRDDHLPYKILAAASANTSDGVFVVQLNGEFDDYNESVDIPKAPKNVKSFEDFFEGLGDAFEENE